MSIYQMAFQQGAAGLELALSGNNAQTRAAYDAAYSAETSRINARNTRHAAQLNIAAIEQDRILSNAQIDMYQQEAEAQAKLNAAAAGVAGQSVEATIYQTEVNATTAEGRAAAAAEQAIAKEKSAVGSATSALQSVRDDEYSNTGALFNVLGSITLDDAKGAYKSFIASKDAPTTPTLTKDEQDSKISEFMFGGR